MAIINRSDVIQKAVNDLAISGNDKIPIETLDKIQLIFGLNKQYSNFVSSTFSGATGTITLSLPSVGNSGEIYITALHFSIIKDATCDIATGIISIAVTPNETGSSVPIIRIPVISLTAQSTDTVLSLPYPLRLKNSSSITIGTTYTAGVMVRSVGVIGFTVSSN